MTHPTGYPECSCGRCSASVASRPVFLPAIGGGLVSERYVEFEWFPGFAAAQKRRSIASLHRAAVEQLEITKVLEISTKSPRAVGVRLSAFNMRVAVEGESSPVLLEAAFQGSKVFRSQGPFTHLYQSSDGREVKRFMRSLPDDELVRFRFAGRDWPPSPRTAFYDWLYLTSLHRLIGDDRELGRTLRGFEGFTDIEFNPRQSFSCQARSCALYLALDRSEMLASALTDPEAFIELLTSHGYGVEPDQGRLL